MLNNAWLSSSAVIAASALTFTAFSFWWLNVRRGRLKSYMPSSFSGAVRSGDARFLLPLAIHNTGAAPIAVQSLRLVLHDSPEQIMWWSLTREHLDDNHRRYPSVFIAKGRDTTQVIAEFYSKEIEFSLPLTDRTVTIEVLTGHNPDWKTLVTFDLHLSNMKAPQQYVAWSNDPYFDDYHPANFQPPAPTGIERVASRP